MKKKDLHDIFIEELQNRGIKKADLVYLISDILKLEKESAYRRLAGKVNFSVREMGILAKALNISLDSLLYQDLGLQWVPVILGLPSAYHSMDSLYDLMESNIAKVKEISLDEVNETGNVYHALPLECYVHSPVLMKFMFFKWGSYFVQSEEFSDFASWEPPSRLFKIAENFYNIYNFQKGFYVWDNALIWNISKEILNFYKMRIINTQEKNEIKNELKEFLLKLEMFLNETYTPKFALPPDYKFYVSAMNLGFSTSYFTSSKQSLALFQTNFSFSMITDSNDKFKKMQEWIRSFCKLSTLFSEGGRIERRLFFNKQHKIIDEILE
ncbi:helix-turn-helix domain-containing protein [Parabacteroides sp. AM08-6]|uniref:helix-turn-helix domain-containing protein n=1 Tax=Parabacteroides sp. AM08-6 TaxID=2292053 RepID=UPI000EFF4D3D|nr:helix-turn-helix domain-containing protein [Parabacteroides sp. AM08-6]RHJ87874.1 hypothetical protein DW103_01530 [Parabacteroides sp. AM08-6]